MLAIFYRAILWTVIIPGYFLWVHAEMMSSGLTLGILLNIGLHLVTFVAIELYESGIEKSTMRWIGAISLFANSSLGVLPEFTSTTLVLARWCREPNARLRISKVLDEVELDEVVLYEFGRQKVKVKCNIVSGGHKRKREGEMNQSQSPPSTNICALKGIAGGRESRQVPSDSYSRPERLKRRHSRPKRDLSAVLSGTRTRPAYRCRLLETRRVEQGETGAILRFRSPAPRSNIYKGRGNKVVYTRGSSKQARMISSS